MSNSCDPMDCSPPGSFCPWDFLSKNTGVGCHFLLQGIFPPQGSNLNLKHCRQILCWLSHNGNPFFEEEVFKAALERCLTGEPAKTKKGSILGRDSSMMETGDTGKHSVCLGTENMAELWSWRGWDSFRAGGWGPDCRCLEFRLEDS